ncbi:hypothetical protein Ccar_13675 [Clostridium carboxidivorans P7]|uniref:Extracellular protein n=1 Tax=Clostridium carboxidivorans P7 TaxID=536227 RepID=C6PXV7_9CLOT|nr:DUF1002 domain-containing protein [Clostridium carboxidivorans]AKN31855.1 hypothetical protein Ccar_13675 [Clostridium carboxidivorans P7]EET85945.1 protein of unknown function DUF1002 [Clostridium carboxidivorans P7]EFG87300.1 hypothetical protein CLCAR_2823 [Clostridium carboxidivorans P7]
MKFKVIMSKLLVMFIVMTVAMYMPLSQVHADAYKNVTLGADLTDSQKQEMLKYFGVTKEEANVLEVNRDEEAKYLKGVASDKQIGTRSISCSYVEPTNEGGLKVSTHNIYWVNESMIRNALITAGIKNANVKAAAPFNVSGTAALTGILKGFENSTGGKKIDENKKEAANAELVTTGNLGEKIGQDKAAGLVNEVKKEVVKEKPKNQEQVEKIVKDVTGKYNYNLSDADIKNLTSLMNKINGLNLNFNDLKSQLNGVTDQLKTTLQSDEAKSFFGKIWAAIRNFFDGIFK